MDLLKKWIATGAEYQPHWSFIAPIRPELPKVKNEAWAKKEMAKYPPGRQASAVSQVHAPAAEPDEKGGGQQHRDRQARRGHPHRELRVMALRY